MRANFHEEMPALAPVHLEPHARIYVVGQASRRSSIVHVSTLADTRPNVSADADAARSYWRYAFPDGSPFQGVPANVQASFGQGQPVPPANQTVSLTC